LLGPGDESGPKRLRFGIKGQIGVSRKNMPEAALDFAFELAASPAAVTQVNAEFPRPGLAL
jgi:hypothetical protein